MVEGFNKLIHIFMTLNAMFVLSTNASRNVSLFVFLENKCYDAFNKGRREEASRLLKQVKDPRTVMSNSNFTLLHCAAYHGWLPIVKQLILEYDFDSDCKDNKGNTPLSKARAKGNQPVVDYLEKRLGTFIMFMYTCI